MYDSQLQLVHEGLRLNLNHKFNLTNEVRYRVTIQLVQNLPLTSKQKLIWPGQAKAEL